jgi:hypothetical protein
MKRIILFCCVLINSIFFVAQNRIYDTGMWLSIGANYKLNSKISFSLLSRVRQYENFTETNSWYIDFGQAYKYKDFKVSIHYAFNPTKTLENYFRNIHQYYIRVDYKKDINKFLSIQKRIIFQHATHRFLSDLQDNGYKPYYRTDLRLRMGVRFKTSARSNIFLHDEIMFTLSRIPLEITRNRVYTGYQKKLSEKLETKLYFVVQSSFHKRNSPNITYCIIGCDFIFSLN